MAGDPPSEFPPLGPDPSPLSRDDIRIAGYQTAPGEGTSLIRAEGVPVDSVRYTPALAGAYRTLFRVDDAAGNTYWYWLMGGVESPDDAVWRIIDLQRSTEYKELSGP